MLINLNDGIIIVQLDALLVEEGHESEGSDGGSISCSLYNVLLGALGKWRKELNTNNIL